MKKDALGTVVLVAIVAICLYIWYKTSDFALALVLITAAFFVIWLGDKLVFARRRREHAAAEGQKPHEPVLEIGRADRVGWAECNEAQRGISTALSFPRIKSGVSPNLPPVSRSGVAGMTKGTGCRLSPA